MTSWGSPQNWSRNATRNSPFTTSGRSPKPGTNHTQPPEKHTRSSILTPVTSYKNQGWDTSTASCPKRSPIDHSGAISSHRHKSFRSRPLKERGQVHLDLLKKASILACQFGSVFTVDDEVSASIHLHGPRLPPIPDVTISKQGVKKLLKGVDLRKAYGPDQVPCRML